MTKTNSGGTDSVWFYDVDADGMSLADKRTKLLADVVKDQGHQTLSRPRRDKDIGPMGCPRQ